MNASSHFQAGNLKQAVEQQLSLVKSNPMDLDARFFLAELSAFQGDWERADRQLDVIVKHPANATLRAQCFRQLIRAEILREQVVSEGRPPELVVPLTRDAELQLELCAAIRAGQTEDYPTLVQQAADSQPIVAGECNGAAFDGLQDLDDRFRGVLEVLTANGRYFWVPWTSIRTLQFLPAERPVDLIWRHAMIDVTDGPTGDVYVPVRYPLPQAWSESHQLARATDWQGEEDSAVTGMGQRIWLVGPQDLSIMECKSLKFQATAPADKATEGV